MCRGSFAWERSFRARHQEWSRWAGPWCWRSCRLLAQGAPSLAKEDIVETGSMERDRGGLQPGAVEDPEQVRDRGLSAVDVEAPEAVLPARLADERLGSDRLEGRLGGPVDPQHHDVAGDLSLEFVSRAFGHDLPVTVDREAVGQGIRLLEVVGGQEDRRAVPAQGTDLSPHPSSTL